MLKKIAYIILCLLIPLSGYTINRLPQPQPGVISPINIPGFNDPMWENVKLWPDKISNGRIIYKIQYMGQTDSGLSTQETVFDFSKIDKSERYSARYWPEDYHEIKDEIEWHYGPFFAWRPDGTLYLKQMTDELGNQESYYLFPDGNICEANLVEIARNLYMKSFYDADGNLLAYEIIQNQFVSDKAMISEYWGDGKFVSKEEFESFYREYNFKCLYNKSLEE